MNVAQLDVKKCTGCGACASICPCNAITMKHSNDGFLYPKVICELCANCGLCTKVCPINIQKLENSANVYSAYARSNEARDAGSSGGVFGLLAKQTLQDNGIVYGAIFDATTKKVIHSSTDEILLEKILRSKYVQSEIGNAYIDAGKQLLSGRKVLFSGTPCQITGFKAYLKLKQIKGDLITVDFMCHGVPSPGFFREYLYSMEEKFGAELLDITFREKDRGWRTQVQKIYFSDGEIYTYESGKHYYYYYFLNNCTLRDSCFACKEYNSHSSDITLADDWETKDDIEDLGTSLVFLNTSSGEKCFEAISTQLIAKQIQKDDFLGYSRYSHKRYNYKAKSKWREYYQKNGFKKTSTVYYKKVKRINEFKQLPSNIKKRILRLLHGIKNVICKAGRYGKIENKKHD